MSPDPAKHDMPTTNPYSNVQLRNFADLLQELKFEIHEPPETWFIDGLVQPWAGFIQTAAIHYKSVVAFQIHPKGVRPFR
jgi:hypothetical protein